MSTQKIKFLNKEGEYLSAILDMPGDLPLGYAIFAHCFTCNKNLTPVRNIAKALTDQHIAVLLFDFTGLGESDGDFARTNFSSNVDDLVSAADFLRNNYQAPSILIGHSLGGAAVLHGVKKIHGVKAIVTIGAPSSPEHVSNLFSGDLEEINSTGEATVTIGSKLFKIRKQFLEDIQGKRIEEAIQSLSLPLLVLHSPVDKVVEIKNASEIFMAARHPKSFVSLDKADHIMTNKEDSIFAGKIIATWAKRYL
jgi:putative redox protein